MDFEAVAVWPCAHTIKAHTQAQAFGAYAVGAPAPLVEDERADLGQHGRLVWWLLVVVRCR